MPERQFDISKLNFESFRGLTEDIITASIVNDKTERLIMTGFMNMTALDKTLKTGRVWFWSRSRRALWDKGATSGNLFELRKLVMNCNGDTLKIYVEPMGPGCHTGADTCFELPSIDENAERI